MVAAISIDVNHGPIGTIVEITGTDYALNDDIDLTFDGSQL